MILELKFKSNISGVMEELADWECQHALDMQSEAPREGEPVDIREESCPDEKEMPQRKGCQQNKNSH